LAVAVAVQDFQQASLAVQAVVADEYLMAALELEVLEQLTKALLVGQEITHLMALAAAAAELGKLVNLATQLVLVMEEME
jgi:hypothetical protein